MATIKTPKIGIYGPKTRALQRTLSYEKTSLTWKTANVYKYLGSRSNFNPQITDISDLIFLENPDRAYATNPIEINIWAEFLPESQFDLSKFGIINPLGNSMQFRVHINSFDTNGLGRFLIPADIIHFPFWDELNSDGVTYTKAYFEITDVDRKSMFENFYVIVTAVPAKDAQETAEIPNLVSDKINLDALEVSFENSMETLFKEAGVDYEPSLYATRDYVADDYFDGFDEVLYQDEEHPRPAYDVRDINAADFLDDPTATKFG